MSVHELEAAVTRLDPADLARFARWFEDFQADEWDRRFEADVAAGRLDALGRQADDDVDAGRATAL